MPDDVGAAAGLHPEARLVFPSPAAVHIAWLSANGASRSRQSSVLYKTGVAIHWFDACMEILFVASVAVIAPEPAQSRELYVDALGLPLAADARSDYWHSEQVAGTKHFGIWPLKEAAEACLGHAEWPADRPTPQASIEFEVADAAAVRASAKELEDRGFELLHPAREEPWGQTVARLLSAEGLIVGISFAPALHTASERAQ